MTEQNFKLTIAGTEHFEWQGRIQKENGFQAEFKSLMELVKIIKAQLEEEE